MKKALKIYASILSCNTLQIDREIDRIIQIGIRRIHLDLMDGSFVNKIFLGEDIINRIVREYPYLDIECHLMVTDPVKRIKYLDTRYINTIIIHQIDKIEEVKDILKETNCTLGIAVEKETEIEEIQKYKKYIDKVLVMGVEPGEGRQKMKEHTERIIERAKGTDNRWRIGVDGGVNTDTIRRTEGADEIVLGSCLYDDNSIERIKEIIKNNN